LSFLLLHILGKTGKVRWQQQQQQQDDAADDVSNDKPK
jgi:hypothetical protein